MSFNPNISENWLNWHFICPHFFSVFCPQNYFIMFSEIFLAFFLTLLQIDICQ